MKRRGFTLIELLVVLAIIAALLTIAVPRYFKSIDHGREVALKQDLAVMRDAIDKHFADRAAYPTSLEDLVQKGYLKAIPEDPITQRRDSWIPEGPKEPGQTGVADIKSGASGTASDGTSYASW